MAPQSNDMPGRGPKKATTANEVFTRMEEGDRPVWTASSLAEDLGVSRPTIEDRLDEVEDDPRVRTMQVANTKAYYVSEEDPRSVEERHKDSLINEFTDRFVGLPSAPWTAVHPNDGPADAGDRVQIRVEGTPGQWREVITHPWSDRREDLEHEETLNDETQALISGKLYAKPTVPVEHVDYPDDYELELNIGGEYKEVEGRSRPILVAGGVKNYLIKPCDNAVFLMDVSVDWISVEGDGQESESVGITEEMIEDMEEWREVQLEESDQIDPAGRFDE